MELQQNEIPTELNCDGKIVSEMGPHDIHGSMDLCIYPFFFRIAFIFIRVVSKFPIASFFKKAFSKCSFENNIQSSQWWSNHLPAAFSSHTKPTSVDDVSNIKCSPHPIMTYLLLGSLVGEDVDALQNSSGDPSEYISLSVMLLNSPSINGPPVVQLQKYDMAGTPALRSVSFTWL